MRRRFAAWPAIIAVAGFGVLHRLGRGYGARRAERTAPLPGDRLVPRPDVICTHATTINASPKDVWPWLRQVGWHRGGWYTARWVDRLLFPDHWASAEELLPEYQDLAIGNVIPDGSPETGCGFIVADLDPQRFMLLDSTTHLPRSWRERGIGALHWIWVFVFSRWTTAFEPASFSVAGGPCIPGGYVRSAMP